MSVRSRRPLAAVAAAAAVAVAGGCDGGGTAASSGPELQAYEATEVFLEVCESGDALAAEQILTEATRARFIESGTPKVACARVLRLLEGEEPAPDEPPAAPLGLDFADLRVTDVTAEGGIAEATIEGADQPVKVELERVGNQWKIANPPLVPPEDIE